ncbi:MAG: TlpA family protein disulfide reductase [bacterium]|nr:TlpA family protein disulfide reductase [bacterium]
MNFKSLFNKAFILIIVLYFLLSTIEINAQKTLPKITLKTIEKESVNIQDVGKEQLTIVSFWATWCVPCIKELDAISDVYEEWQEELEVKLVAVSIDDSRTISRVKPLVNGKGWEYDILLDTNHDFKRAMNVVNVPYLIIVKEGKIVYKHSGYTSGSEHELYEKLIELSENE